MTVFSSLCLGGVMTENKSDRSREEIVAPTRTDPARRRTPLQARGQATVETILEVTARLVDEVGHEAVNTNLIASTAGINVATLYQYFSNKQAILLALFERQTAVRVKVLEQNFTNIGIDLPWREMIYRSIDAMADMRMEQPGSVGIRLAVLATPELVGFAQRANKSASEALARSLVRMCGIPLERAQLVSAVCTEFGIALMDLWIQRDPRHDRSVLEEMKRVYVAYLATYLEPGGA